MFLSLEDIEVFGHSKNPGALTYSDLAHRPEKRFSPYDRNRAERVKDMLTGRNGTE